MKPREGRYLVTVDHLRALAALLIIFYHGSQLIGFFLRTGIEGFSPIPWPRAAGPVDALIIEGHSAVSLFMVLSGFIFTHGNWGQEIAYRSFVANRLWRIYPLFLFVNLYGWTVYPLNFTPASAVQVFVPFIRLTGAAESDLTVASWAVSVELQFYLVFPFLQRFSRRFGLRYLFGVIAFFLLLRVWAYIQTTGVQPYAYWSILGRMDQFVLGMLVAHAHHRVRLSNRVRAALLVPALALLFAWVMWFNRTGGWPANEPNRLLWPLGEGLAYAGVIYCYLAFEELGRFRDSLPARLLARVGEMSFSLYLLHFAIVKSVIHSRWLIKFDTDPARGALLNTLLVVVPAALALAALSFNLIERPFFQFRKSHRPSP